MNSEGFTVASAEKLQLLATFKNNWRQRYVEVYQHPTDDTKVVSIGRSELPHSKTGPVVCVEQKSEYARQIGRFGITCE